LTPDSVKLQRRRSVRIFRGVWSIFWVVIFAAAAASPKAKPDDRTTAITIAAITFVSAIMFLRMRTTVSPWGVEVRNWFRTIRFPWTDVAWVGPLSGGWATSELGIGAYVGFVLTSGERVRARSTGSWKRRVAQELVEQALRHRPTGLTWPIQPAPLSQQSPPGWYPDPAGSPTLKLWDGHRWTDPQ
jgi:hypothetical protein